MAIRNSTRRASRAAPTRQNPRKPTPKQSARLESLRASHEATVKSWLCARSAEAMLRVVSAHMNTIQHSDAFDSDAFGQMADLACSEVGKAIEALGAKGMLEALREEILSVEGELFNVYGAIVCASHALKGRKPLKDGEFVDWPQGYALKCAATILADKCLPPLDRISVQLRSQIAEDIGAA